MNSTFRLRLVASLLVLAVGCGSVVVDKSASDEPASDEPASDEPATDEPASDEPTVLDELASDEPASKESTTATDRASSDSEPKKGTSGFGAAEQGAADAKVAGRSSPEFSPKTPGFGDSSIPGFGDGTKTINDRAASFDGETKGFDE